MKYLCFVICIYISVKECTIDVNIQELVYIADHLTDGECRLLFASLHFVSYNLPANLSDAEETVPDDVPCVKLLVKWNSGEQLWEGKGKTHDIIERRLRQIGRSDLADWLGKLVFHKLAKQVNKSLEDELFLENDKTGVNNKIFEDIDLRDGGEKWTILDSILIVTLIGLLLITLTALCRMLKLTFRRAKVKRKDSKNPGEIVNLISNESLDSDQETVYEFDMEENGKRSHVSFDLDIEKAAEEESDK